MRWLRLGSAVLLASLALLLPLPSGAYSEWPAISTRATQLSQEEEIPLRCCLESHVGNIYFKGNLAEYGLFIRFMLELGHYLSEHTNAGPTYLIHVHFPDHVRVISLHDLETFHHKVKTGFNDPKLLYEFFSRFQSR